MWGSAEPGGREPSGKSPRGKITIEGGDSGAKTEG